MLLNEKTFRDCASGFVVVIPVSTDERFIPLELFTGGEIGQMIQKLNIHQKSKNVTDKIFGEKRRKKKL